MPLNDSANEEGSSPTKFLIQNARIIDGTGSPSFLSSVLVEGDTIVSISSDQGNPEGVQIIDGRDGQLCLCPGFIDMHAHSDLSLLHTPSHEAKITQGVTSEVIGQVRFVLLVQRTSIFSLMDHCMGCPLFST